MGLQEVVSWYQKKIGTYDKQAWERTIEQRILHGLTNVPRKSTTLKTDLIDVDLVRGSSFPKAKPKHGFAEVSRLALLRLVFFPAYGGWWIQQTSGRAFTVLLLLYTLQIGNMAAFYYLINNGMEDMLERISHSEIVLPVVMMLVLSLIHSQIVSTHTDTKRTKGALNQRSRRVRRTKRRITRSASTSKPDTFVRRPANDRLRPQAAEREPTPLDDDGFESLNGNGSSENGDEENKENKRTLASARSALNWQPATDALDSGFQPPAVGGGPGGGGGVSGTGEQDGNFRHAWLHEVLTARRPEVDTVRRRTSAVKAVPLVTLDNKIVACSDIGTDDEEDPAPLLPPAPPPESSYNSSCESEANHVSAGEWPGITTNSDDCSYSSELEQSADQDTLNDHPFAWEFGLSPTVILSPSCAASDRVSCTMWERRDAKKADLSVLDISSAIIARVETMPNDEDYFYGGFLLSIGLSFVPPLCRLTLEDSLPFIAGDVTATTLNIFPGSVVTLLHTTLGQPGWERAIVVVALLERCLLASMFFFLLAVAERTFKQRFLFAKLFSQLTSSRRARKSDLPHFRLNKVRNIKTWLSVRSYLKRRGPQRSVDVIVSGAFIITLLLLSFLSVECLKDSARVHTQYILEALFWCLGLGVFLLRFMTLGTKINRKYRNLSVLITEQINLYLQIEQKPHKKDELMVANSVLKLAADLLKELECPFKISGLSANPYLYTITKVVILSALSGVLSELLGFKLKLHKIKIK